MRPQPLLACAAAVLSLGVREVAAAPPEPPVAPAEAGAPTPAPLPAGVDDAAQREREAHVRFEKGVRLTANEEWGAALAEFVASRKLYPSAGATTDAAVCLGKLRRHDEALDMFEALLREFPALPAEKRLAAQQEVVRLRELTGTLELEDAEPDAAITLDGQSRGEYPPLAPLHVGAGTHTVRVYKEGFEPFETRVEVAGRQTVRVSARLRASSRRAADPAGATPRFEDPAEVVEALLLASPTAFPPGARAAAQRAVVELRQAMGTVDLGEAEPGTSIMIDGRSRGEYPSLAPLRVGAGDHVLRLYHQGFEVYEARVRVGGGQTVRVAAPLRPLTRAGRLRVAEGTGAAFEVLLDGFVVGATPWEGFLAVGEHTVALRGEGNLGTAPATTRIHVSGEDTALDLRAEELSASLRVEPTPADARITIDGVPVGDGFWEGRLRPGAHTVTLAAEGLQTVTRTVELKPAQPEVVAVSLERDADVWSKLKHVTLELDTSLALAPSLGGDLSAGCGAGCSQSLGHGGLALLQVGYPVGGRFELGVTAGYLFVDQETRRSAVTFTPVGQAAEGGMANDQVHLGGAVLGATGSARFGGHFPLRLRLGAGAVPGSLRDARTATLAGPQGQATATGTVWPAATCFYLAPELRVGWQLGREVEVSAGLQALVLFDLSRPSWEGQQVAASGGTPGHPGAFGTFGAGTVGGDVSVLLAPGLGVRHAF